LSSFLLRLLRAPERRFALYADSSRTVLATRVETAFDSATRRRGLLGRTTFDGDTALIIAPCCGVHTFFMRMAIDVVFASRDGLVIKTYSQLRPWRVAFAFRAFAAIELPAGSVTLRRIQRGDRLLVVETEIVETGESDERF
jgi:uncharacterized membrane protein (UPF0127 family)